jgi:hypothetical protein
MVVSRLTREKKYVMFGNCDEIQKRQQNPGKRTAAAGGLQTKEEWKQVPINRKKRRGSCKKKPESFARWQKNAEAVSIRGGLMKNS